MTLPTALLQSVRPRRGKSLFVFGFIMNDGRGESMRGEVARFPAIDNLFEVGGKLASILGS